MVYELTSKYILGQNSNFVFEFWVYKVPSLNVDLQWAQGHPVLDVEYTAIKAISKQVIFISEYIKIK